MSTEITKELPIFMPNPCSLQIHSGEAIVLNPKYFHKELILLRT